jgi:O-acetyl-ADP-ribose deacetylase (regulator of RNase III)/uncharacterized protein YwgA
MFHEPAEAIVNTVNCVGVMGKGVALEFKNRWPENFRAYKSLCDAGSLRPGRMFVFRTPQLFESNEPRYLINFPTKDHWRGKSQLQYIADGLDDLIAQVRANHIRSIAMPPLGCGNGGLDWADVKPIIERKLSDLDADITVFAPATLKESTDIKMTFERAVLLRSLGDLAHHFEGAFTRVSLHKVIYFLQQLGLNLRFEYTRNAHGPYSEKLKTVLLAMEKQKLIDGFSAPDQLTQVVTSAYDAAQVFLNDNNLSSKADDILNRLDLLIDGYESPYGLELLSSVHYINATEGKQDTTEIISELRAWNDRKGATYKDAAIELALSRLKEDGLAA